MVANGEELAELPLARRNNSTTSVSIIIPACIDAPRRALSNDGNGRIDLPGFRSF